MPRSLTKRQFLLSTLTLPAVAQPVKVPDRGPALDAALVKEFVVAAHKDLEKTQALLASQPGLINATWDWGGGDFETALGGASHMGQREIALFLLGQGARADIFAAAMLGMLDVVKALCEALPGIHRVPGPHKIPLIAHARKGGAIAEPVAKFLADLS